MRSRGERMRAVRTWDAMGREKGGWWKGGIEGKKRERRTSLIRGCIAVDNISASVEVARPVWQE